MKEDEGIINKIDNPFARKNWIKQGFPLTPKRQTQLLKIIGKDIKTISSIRPENCANYVAFVAIRWGFATIKDSKLNHTEKWINRYDYDNHGQHIVDTIN